MDGCLGSMQPNNRGVALLNMCGVQGLLRWAIDCCSVIGPQQLAQTQQGEKLSRSLVAQQAQQAQQAHHAVHRMAGILASEPSGAGCGLALRWA